MRTRYLLILVVSLCLTPSFLLAQTRIDAESVLSLIKSKQIKSIEQLLPLLPDELRSNFSLVYASRNKLQVASFEQPRIIFFSNDGGFQIAMTGKSDSRGGKTLEMLSQDESGRFNPVTVDFTGGAVKIDRSPKNCVNCHGAEIRPIWDSYPRWPGVYGSDHDLLRKDPRLRTRGRLGESLDDLMFKENSPEYSALQRFLKTGVYEERYRFLSNLRKMNYEDLANLNSHFTATLEHSTNRQILQRFINESKVKGLGRKLLAFMKMPGDTSQIVGPKFLHYDGEPEHYEAALLEEKKNLEDLKNRRSNEMDAYLSKLDVRDKAISGSSEIKRRAPYLKRDEANFIDLEFFGKQAGISDEFWKPGIQGTIRFMSGNSSSIEEMRTTLIEALVEQNPELKDFTKSPPRLEITQSVQTHLRKTLDLDEHGIEKVSTIKLGSTLKIPMSPIKNQFPFRDSLERRLFSCQDFFKSLFGD